MLNKSYFGAVHTPAGGYYMRRVIRKANGWRIGRSYSLPVNTVMRKLALKGKGVMLGVSSTWFSSKRTQPAGEYVRAKSVHSFVPFCRQWEHALLENAFVDNVDGVAADDSFLATIPLAFLANCPSSFVSMYTSESVTHVGLVVDRFLRLSLSIAPATEDTLRGHLERIRYYWESKEHHILFPDVVVIIGKEIKKTATGMADKIACVWPDGIQENDSAGLVSAGIALVRPINAVPLFLDSPVQAAVQRRFRAIAYYLSSFLMISAALLVVTPFLLNVWMEQQFSVCESTSARPLENDTKAQRLLNESIRLAQHVNHLERTFTPQVSWTQLLDDIGRQRPEGLFLTDIGNRSEGKRREKEQVEVSGWTLDDKLVSTMMTNLNNLEYVSQAALTSMERPAQNKNIIAFKISCTLNSSNN